MTKPTDVMYSRLIDKEKINKLIQLGFQPNLIKGADDYITSKESGYKNTLLSAKDGEVILKYHSSSQKPSGIYLITGKGVDHEEIRALIAFYLLSRIESPIREDLEPSFFEEVQLRNYDLTTFKLYLSKNKTIKKKVGAPRTKQRQLKLQFGKLADQKEDMCILWGEGCSSSDGHLLMYHFSSLVYTSCTGTWSDKLVDALDAEGFNPKTLKLSIEKPKL